MVSAVLYRYIYFLLTTEIEIDWSGHLAELVLGLDFVESSVALDDVVELQDDEERPSSRLLDADVSSIIFADGHGSTVPKHLKKAQKWG